MGQYTGQYRLVALAGAIAVAIAGCSSEQTAETPTTTPSPAAAPASPAASPAPKTQAFAKPLVAQKPTLPGAIPGLIQPTNSKERGAQIAAQNNSQKSRDPFASLPPAPIRSVPNGSQPGGAASKGNAPQQGSQNRLPGATPLLPTPEMPKVAIAPPSTPKTVALNPRPTIVLPPKPSTDLAKGVEVTGVIMVGGAPKAIVKAPNEDTSRYVSVGERLSSGKVLVKRIEMNSGSEPIVILEENGVEIARSVGDKPIAQTGKPSA